LSVGILTAPDARRVTFADLAEIIRNDYKKQSRRSLDRLEIGLRHLTAHFGACRALAISSDRIIGYECMRLAAGAARASVNYELAVLRHAFNLAMKAGRLTSKPIISIPDPRNEKSGFFEEADFRGFSRVTRTHPACHAVLLLDWLAGGKRSPDVDVGQVDFEAGVVRLEQNTTKSGQGRVFPFDVLPELAALLEDQREHTSAVERRTGQVIPYVFHRNGRPIRAYLDGWRTACKRASVVKRDGLEIVNRPRLVGRTPHNFRRTAARELIRAGVPQHVVMLLCGWRTADMFRRYCVTDERDLRSAVEMPARGTIGGQSKARAERASGFGGV
jgi:integrase